MNLEFKAQFKANDNGWSINEPFQTIVSLSKVAENVTIAEYASGTITLQVSLSDNEWIILCNRPLELIAPGNGSKEWQVNVIH